MAIITTPGAGVSPYQTTDTTPTVLRASANGATTISGQTVYAAGQAALNSLITSNQPGTFQGANVNITLEEQNFNTTNQVTSTINYADGANGSIQYNNGANGFAGDPYFTYTNGNLVTPGIKTDGYYYANGVPFSGGGGGGNTFSAITMTSTPGGASNQINYGLGNLFVWNDGGWTIGEYNGTTSGTEGIRINPDIEGPVDVTLPSTQSANTQPTSLSNFLGNVVVNSGNNYVSYQWKFKNDGNLILPDAANVGIKYANGTPYGGGGNANTGNVTFSDQIVIGTGDQYGGSGLYLAPGTDSVANLQYLRVRGGDNPTHIHFDTGNYQYYDQYFGDDNKYLKLEAGLEGNVVIGTYNGAGNSWIFGTDANTYLPGNILGSGNLKIAPDATNSSAYLDVYLTYGPDIHVAGNGENLILGADNGANVTVGANGNVDIQTWNGTANTWTFGNDGTFTTPGETGNITGANVISANTFVTPSLTIDAMGQITAASNSVVSLIANGSQGGFLVDYYGNTNTDANTSGGEIALNGGANVELTIGLSSDSGNGAASRVWRYNTAGQTSFPILTTQRGDSATGTVTGYTLNGGTGDYEFVISTPDGVTGIDNSQRLVINPGKGRDGTSGEGGDIYLWAGRGGSGDPGNAVSAGSGGDVKIRGGHGGGVDGDGGYIRMEAGDSASSAGGAGFIEITGGYGGTSTGGYVRILAGSGNVTGGDANLTGGYGSVNGGAVNITGGISANSLSQYGNVYIHAGASTWTFDNTGNLTTPGVLGNISNVDVITANTVSANVYTSAQADGNVFISTSENQFGPLATWIFDPVSDGTGNMIFPTGMHISTDGAGGTRISQNANVTTVGLRVTSGGNATMSTGWNELEEVAVGNIALIAFNQSTSPGNLSVITGNASSTFYKWTFDKDGGLTLPYDAVVKTTSDSAIAIGVNAGTGGSSAVSLGVSAGANAQSFDAIAIGGQAGANTQGGGAIAIGGSAGADTQGAGAIAIGPNAGQFGQGTLAIAIGASAGYNVQASSSIVINATGSELNNITANSFVIAPVRNDVSNVTNSLYYNTSTFEVTYGPAGGGSYGNANVATFLGNFGSNAISTTGNIASGNVSGNGYAKFSGSFDESQAATAGLYVGYAGGTPRIMFGTGNTSQTFEIDNDSGTLRFYQPGSTKASLTSGGVFTANVVVTTPQALSSLTAVAGGRAFVNDGNLVAAGNFGAQIGSGGSNVVPVWSNGTNWYIG